jgi:hypothetical protein
MTGKIVYMIMRKLILLAAIAFSNSNAFSQSQVDINAYNRQKNKITSNGMKVLAGWSAANVIYSAIATGQSSGSSRYFHQMNVMWGSINLGISALGYLGTKNKDGMSLIESLKKQSGVEKTYLFNAGLDLAYIASGFYLKERSKSTIKNPQKLKGYGESIIMQGAALLLLDGVMFTLHNRHGKKLFKMMDKVQVGATGNGISMLVKL